MVFRGLRFNLYMSETAMLSDISQFHLGGEGEEFGSLAHPYLITVSNNHFISASRQYPTFNHVGSNLMDFIIRLDGTFYG